MDAPQQAELGYRFFPCQINGKAPAIAHGVKDSTDDTERIELWLSNGFNLGMDTTGLLVVDVDGAENPWLAQVDQSELMAAPTQRTPGGGLHFIFKQPDDGRDYRNTAGKIAAKVDTRADGGYICVAPSTIGKTKYQWIYDLEVSRDKLPEPPKFVIDALFPSYEDNGERGPGVEELAEQTHGEGTRNQMLTRYAGFLRRGGSDQVEIAAALHARNATKCDPPLPSAEVDKIAWSIARHQPDEVEAITISEGLTFIGNGTAVEDEPDDDEGAIDPGTLPQEIIDGMPPVMREYYDWILETAINPLPEISLGAVIAAFGTVYGQKVTDNYNTRTHVYTLALAPSGAGKDHPRVCNKQLYRAAQADEALMLERIGSHSGLVNAVAAQRRQLIQIDEFGRTLALMKNPGQSHQFQTSTVLMELYSAAKDRYTTDGYADLAKRKVIEHPSVSLYATTVPHNFFDNLSHDTSIDGFMGRMMIFESARSKVTRPPSRGEAPPRVVEHIRHWYHDAYRQNAIDEAFHTAAEIEKTDDAHDRHESHCAQVRDRHHTEAERAVAIWSRSPEKVGKLALIHACATAEHGQRPFIGIESENWAIMLSNYLTRYLLCKIEENVTDSAADELKRKTWGKIRDGMSKRAFTRKTQFLSKRARDEMLVDFAEAGAIAVEAKEDSRQMVIRKLRKNYKAL